MCIKRVYISICGSQKVTLCKLEEWRRSRLVFGKYSVRISVSLPVILTVIFLVPDKLTLTIRVFFSCSYCRLPRKKRKCSVSISDQATGWRTGVRFPTGVGIFSLRHRIQTRSGTHPASYPMGTGGLFPRVQSGRGVKLTTHLHLVPRLRMREAIPPLPSYVFVARCLNKQRLRLHGVVFN
jgi:hypothetical protein